MLRPAVLYKESLSNKVINTWFVDKYKYWNCASYHADQKINEDTWSKNQFVSVDKNGGVIGFIGYDVDRETCYANSLSIINFSEDIITFGIDLKTAIDDIFTKYNFGKLSFSVVVGNPIEKSYDKMCSKYGGRILGIKEKHCKLVDGNFYDLKLYEIMRENYIKAVKK